MSQAAFVYLLYGELVIPIETWKLQEDVPNFRLLMELLRIDDMSAVFEFRHPESRAILALEDVIFAPPGSLVQVDIVPFRPQNVYIRTPSGGVLGIAIRELPFALYDTLKRDICGDKEFLHLRTADDRPVTKAFQTIHRGNYAWLKSLNALNITCTNKKDSSSNESIAHSDSATAVWSTGGQNRRLARKRSARRSNSRPRSKSISRAQPKRKKRSARSKSVKRRA